MVIKVRIALVVSLMVLAVTGIDAQTQQPLQKIVINYPTRTGQIWPLYIAKEGGYYQKYGYDVNLVFGVHPAGIAMLVSGEAAMTAYTLEQAMTASSVTPAAPFASAPGKRGVAKLPRFAEPVIAVLRLLCSYANCAAGPPA